MEYILAPSILGADFTRLGEEIKTVAEAGAEYIHLDVSHIRYGKFLSPCLQNAEGQESVTAWRRIYLLHILRRICNRLFS